MTMSSYGAFVFTFLRSICDAPPRDRLGLCAAIPKLISLPDTRFADAISMWCLCKKKKTHLTWCLAKGPASLFSRHLNLLKCIVCEALDSVRLIKSILPFDQSREHFFLSYNFILRLYPIREIASREQGASSVTSAFFFFLLCRLCGHYSFSRGPQGTAVQVIHITIVNKHRLIASTTKCVLFSC